MKASIAFSLTQRLMSRIRFDAFLHTLVLHAFVLLATCQGVAARLGVEWSVAKKWEPLAKDGSNLVSL